jgi:stage V sporulation protein D (sporulation-specific penicillin-binding protein)
LERRKKQKRKLNGTMRKKLAGLFILVLLALVGLTFRITYINAKSGDKYKKQVLIQSQQQYDSRTIPFKRGDITDRNGTVLATSSKVYNVILDCKVVNSNEAYMEPTVKALTEQLGLDEDTIRGLLTGEQTKNSQYQILKKEISMDEKKTFEAYTTVPEDSKLSEEERLERKNVQGVWFEEDYLRNYPMNSLACDTIGFTFAGNVADWGLEGYYNSTLNGVDGRKYGYFNQDSDLEQTIIDPVNGNSIESTLDVNIQQVVEKYISAFDKVMAKEDYSKKDKDKDDEEKEESKPDKITKGAANIGVIVANPNNGEILAMASSDPYDLNNPRDLTGMYTEEEIKKMNDETQLDALNAMWQNYCITEAYEPGSTVKPIIVASALASGAISEADTFVCDGGQQVADRFIKCSIYPDAHGTQSLGEVIQNSCNDGLMAIGKKMGADTFLRYQKIFNFGSRTGIDLPGEGTGILHTKDTLNAVELATSSFGQGFTCTMVQEIAAISAVINGGTYYQPHMVSKIVDDKGKTVKSIEPTVFKQAISSDISAEIREYMGMSVKAGTSKTSKVQGYSMGGKTGTAQKIPRGSGKYLVSFVGFAPLDNPQVVIYVVIDEVNAERQDNSKYPQYIAQAVLSEILPYMDIFPDEETKEATVLWEGFTGIKKQNDVSAEEGEEGDVREDDTSSDGIEDQNVPEPPEEEKDEEGTEPNNEETDGITNEEAGLSE